MVRSKTIIVGALMLLLGACSATPPLTVETTLPDVSVQDAQPVVMQDYTWKVYTKKDIQSIAADLSKHPSKDVLIFGVNQNGYKRQYHNMVELKRYIEEQRSVIVYLKKEIHDRSIPAAADTGR